jgi:hypothetical protein
MPASSRSGSNKTEGKDSAAKNKKWTGDDRHKRLIAFARQMRTAGLGVDAIKVALGAENQEQCDPALDDADIGIIAAKAEPQKGKESKVLADMALETYRFGRSDQDEPIAVAKNGPNVARMFKGSQSLRKELARDYQRQAGKPATAAALTDALAALEGEALDADQEAVALRFGRLDDGRLVLDLGSEDGQAVVIGPGGWEVVEVSPVLFRRTKATRPLPMPDRHGDLELLRPLLNVTDDDWQLDRVWLVAAFFADIAHPVLLFDGEHGVGKTLTAGFLARTVDPSAAQVGGCPTNLKDWKARAYASQAFVLDNISNIQPWLSDALCRAVTGDGFRDRELYSDHDPDIIELRRLVEIAAVDGRINRGDLAERCIPNELALIADDQRRSEVELVEHFEAAHGKILGGLLNLVAEVLVVLPDVQPDRLPRMADFYRIAVAVDRITNGDAAGLYLKRVTQALMAVAEGDELAQAIKKFMKKRKEDFEGSARILLLQLTDYARGPYGAPPKDWPKTPEALSKALNRISQALRIEGITIEPLARTGKGRRLRIRKGRSATVTTVTPSPDGAKTPFDQPKRGAQPGDGSGVGCDGSSDGSGDGSEPSLRPKKLLTRTFAVKNRAGDGGDGSATTSTTTTTSHPRPRPGMEQHQSNGNVTGIASSRKHLIPRRPQQQP